MLTQRVSQSQEPKTSAAEAGVVEAGKEEVRLDREAVTTPTGMHCKASGGSSGTGTRYRRVLSRGKNGVM